MKYYSFLALVEVKDSENTVLSDRPTTLHIKTYDRAAHNLYHTEQLPYFNLHQRGPPGRINEWQLLLDYLYSKQKVNAHFGLC